jgi:hypothetical protein
MDKMVMPWTLKRVIVKANIECFESIVKDSFMGLEECLNEKIR